MKYLHADGILLDREENSRWILTETLLKKEDESTRLCLLKCANETIAKKIAFAMEQGVPGDMENDKDDFISLRDPNFRLFSFKNYIVTTANLLETYYDGKIVESTPENDEENIIYYVNLTSQSVLKLNLKPSIGDLPSQMEIGYSDELEEDDYTEFFLGAKLRNHFSKGSAIKTGYNFPKLVYPNDEGYQILWLPAPPQKGQAMFSAYGCTADQAAVLFTHLLNEARKAHLLPEKWVAGYKGDILVASEEMLTKIFGNSVKIKQSKPGFIDTAEAHREQRTQEIYALIDEKKSLTTKKIPHPTNPFANERFSPTLSIFNPPETSFTQPSVQTSTPPLNTTIETSANDLLTPLISPTPYVSSTQNMSTEDWVASVIIGDADQLTDTSQQMSLRRISN